MSTKFATKTTRHDSGSFTRHNAHLCGTARKEKKRKTRLTLAPVKHARAEHHVPHLVGIAGVLADDETLVVLLDEPARGGSTKSSCVADGTVGRMDLDEDGAEDADTPRRARGAILVVLVHRAGNVALDDWGSV